MMAENWEAIYQGLIKALAVYQNMYKGKMHKIFYFITKK
jgi:hypothetical protein